MCGINGYYSYNVYRSLGFIVDQVTGGLKRLEYRGYDSAGVCVDVVDDYELVHNHCWTQDNSHGSNSDDDLSPLPCNTAFPAHAAPLALTASMPVIVKEAGKVETVEKATLAKLEAEGITLDKQLKCTVSIGHTRWATHGPPCAKNSHPHVSDSQNAFVVVHNGIITNYAALKEMLIGHGEVFISETDTEVIPKLFNYLHLQTGGKLNFAELAMAVIRQLEGAFAILVKSRYFPGEMVAAKRGSPLIFGIVENAHATRPARISFSGMADASHDRWRANTLECYLASDASAVVEKTKKVVTLEDDDVLYLRGSGFGFFNARAVQPDAAVERKVEELKLEVSQIQKGGYDHFMQKEIHEQPESLAQVMGGRIQPAGSDGCPWVKLGGLVDHLRSIRKARRIMLVACGTSYHACLAARQTLEEMTELPVSLEVASDLLDRQCPILREDVCVFVSQSGETADTLQALRYAKSQGALCVGITNTVGSAISRNTTCGVHLNAGPEIGVASTKAYTAQICVLNAMALQLAQDSVSKAPARATIARELTALPGKVRQALKLDGAMHELAEQLKNQESILFFGRGYHVATALEAALKVKEVSLIHSEGLMAGEMKHGPLALVGGERPLVVVATRDSQTAKMLSVIQQLKAREGKLIVLHTEGDEEVMKAAGSAATLIPLPPTVDALQPVLAIVPLQLLAYHLTCLRGHNVDQPRNLAKSVTVAD